MAFTEVIHKTLRMYARVVIVVILIAILWGYLPAKEYYRDASDCFGRAFSAHGGGGGCTPSWVHERTVGAGGLSTTIYLLVAALPGLWLYLQPRLAITLVWMGWWIAASIAALVITFDLELFEYTRHLWTSTVHTLLVGGLFVAVVLVLPCVAGILAYRNRPPKPEPPIAPARIHRDKRR